MFDPGSAKPNPRAQILLRAVAKIAARLPNRITISGHTSANSDGSKSANDWSLSAQRADASRQIKLQDAGVDADRIYQVSGKAASDPLFPDDPTLPGNRRIAIVLLREVAGSAAKPRPVGACGDGALAGGRCICPNHP